MANAMGILCSFEFVRAAALPLQKRIPVGFDFHARYPLSVRTLLDEISHEHTPSKFLEKLAAKEKACAQLGTLGGGNHFLEVHIYYWHLAPRAHAAGMMNREVTRSSFMLLCMIIQ